MRKLKGLLILFLVLELTAQFLSGCPKRLTEGKTVSVASFLSDKGFLDPAQAATDDEIQIASQILDGLVEYDPKTGEVKPAVAKEWKMSPDAKTFTFYLRKGVKFHNGCEVTAKDFKYSWERVTSPETGSIVSYVLSPIEGVDDEGIAEKGLSGVKVVDDYTLEVKLKYPFADFPATLAHTVASPIPKEVVKKYGDNFNKHVVGAGPFKLKEWKSGDSVTLVKNENYYGGSPLLDKVVFKVHTNPETASVDFRAGNLDIISIPPGQFGLYEKDRKEGKTQIVKKAALSTYFFGFNVEKDPFKGEAGKLLRQALNYALDRKDIAERVMKGAVEPATGIVPSAIPGYDKDVSPYDFELKKAKDLIKQAYPGGAPELTLVFPAEAGREDLIAAAEEQWRQAGIPVKLQSMEGAAFEENLAKGEISFFSFLWIADYVSQDSFLYPLFHSSQVGSNNFWFYNNPTVDKLIKEARAEKDSSKREKLYLKAEKLILSDPPLTPVFFDTNAWAAQNKVKNFDVTAVGFLPLEKFDLK